MTVSIGLCSTVTSCRGRTAAGCGNGGSGCVAARGWRSRRTASCAPNAGFFGGTSWLNTHAKQVETAQASKGLIDVLLVGDSITMQWGAAWTKHFPTLKTVNLGIGGDKTQKRAVASRPW